MNSRTLHAELASSKHGWVKFIWPWAVIARQNEMLEALDRDRNALADALARRAAQKRSLDVTVRALDRQLTEQRTRLGLLEHTLRSKVHFRDPKSGRLLKKGVVPPGIGV